MTGVEILTSAQIATDYIFNWNGFWTIMGVGLGLGLIMGIIAILTADLEWTALPNIIFVSIVLGSICGVGCGIGTSTPTSYETQYKVTISDEVTMSDFYEHYEIINQEGKIFTVREKTN